MHSRMMKDKVLAADSPGFPRCAQIYSVLLHSKTSIEVKSRTEREPDLELCSSHMAASTGLAAVTHLWPDAGKQEHGSGSG